MNINMKIYRILFIVAFMELIFISEGICIIHQLQNGKSYAENHTFPDGAKYDGEMLNGKFHGFGSFTSPDGTIYKGSWGNDAPEGDGLLITKDHNKYKGKFHLGKMHGSGTMEYADGSKYIGNWKDGFKSGRGQFIMKDGSDYDGNWLNDKKNGLGKMKYSHGNNFIGMWKDGEINGPGVMKYSDGSLYEGHWVKNKQNGIGEVTTQNGNKYIGIWKDGHEEGTQFLITQEILNAREFLLSPMLNGLTIGNKLDEKIKKKSKCMKFYENGQCKKYSTNGINVWVALNDKIEIIEIAESFPDQLKKSGINKGISKELVKQFMILLKVENIIQKDPFISCKKGEYQYNCLCGEEGLSSILITKK